MSIGGHGGRRKGGTLRIAKIVIDGEVYVDFEATKKEIENQSKSE